MTKQELITFLKQNLSITIDKTDSNMLLVRLQIYVGDEDGWVDIATDAVSMGD